MIGRLLNGLTIVVIGAVLLMNTTGYLPWSVWDSALEFWPILIIGLGVQIAFSKWRVPGLNLALLVILILGAMFPYRGNLPLHRKFQLPIYRNAEISQSQLDVPLEGRTSGINLKLAAPSCGVFMTGDTQNTDTAVFGELVWSGPQPSVSQASQGRELDVNVWVPEGGMGVNAITGTQNWSFFMNSSLVSKLVLDGGVVDLELDTRNLYVESLAMNAGVGCLELNMGLSGKQTTIVLKGGVANVKLETPESVGLSITVLGPSAVYHDFSKEGLSKSGGCWMTPGFDEATTKLELTVVSGLSRIQLARS